MKKDKICISKAGALMIPVTLLIIAVILFSSYMSNNSQKKTGSNVRAGAGGLNKITTLTNCYDSNDTSKAVGYPVGYCSPYTPGAGQFICNMQLDDVKQTYSPAWVKDEYFECLSSDMNAKINALTGNGVDYDSITKLKEKSLVGQCVAEVILDFVNDNKTIDEKIRDAVKQYYSGYKSCKEGTVINPVRTACAYGGVEKLTASSEPYRISTAEGCIMNTENKKIGLKCTIETAFENEVDKTGACKSELAAQPVAKGNGCNFQGTVLPYDGTPVTPPGSSQTFKVISTKNFTVQNNTDIGCILYNQPGTTDKVLRNQNGFIHWFNQIDPKVGYIKTNLAGGFKCDEATGKIVTDSTNCPLEDMIVLAKNRAFFPSVNSGNAQTANVISCTYKGYTFTPSNTIDNPINIVSSISGEAPGTFYMFQRANGSNAYCLGNTSGPPLSLRCDPNNDVPQPDTVNCGKEANGYPANMPLCLTADGVELSHTTTTDNSGDTFILNAKDCLVKNGLGQGYRCDLSGVGLPGTLVKDKSCEPNGNI